MTLKSTALVILLAYISAGWASIAYTPITKAVVDTEYDHNPQYTYSYGVEDSITGDSKSQTETRNGDIVTGQYSLIEPDGSKRIVDYTADPINGFNAVVRKATPAVTVAYTPPVVAKVPSVAYAGPVISKVTAPVAYTTPVISKLAVPVANGLSSLSYASAPITNTVIRGRTVNYASPLVYSANLGHGYVGAHSALYPYSDYGQLYTNPLTYAKVHY